MWQTSINCSIYQDVNSGSSNPDFRISLPWYFFLFFHRVPSLYLFSILLRFTISTDASWFDRIFGANCKYVLLLLFSFETARRQSYQVDNIGGCPETLCGGGDSGVSGDSTTPTGETPTESDRRGRGFEPRHWKKTYCQEHSKPIIFRITWSRPQPERNWATAQWVGIFIHSSLDMFKFYTNLHKFRPTLV